MNKDRKFSMPYHYDDIQKVSLLKEYKGALNKILKERQAVKYMKNNSLFADASNFDFILNNFNSFDFYIKGQLIYFNVFQNLAFGNDPDVMIKDKTIQVNYCGANDKREPLTIDILKTDEKFFEELRKRMLKSYKPFNSEKSHDAFQKYYKGIQSIERLKEAYNFAVLQNDEQIKEITGMIHELDLNICEYAKKGFVGQTRLDVGICDNKRTSNIANQKHSKSLSQSLLDDFCM